MSSWWGLIGFWWVLVSSRLITYVHNSSQEVIQTSFMRLIPRDLSIADYTLGINESIYWLLVYFSPNFRFKTRELENWAGYNGCKDSRIILKL